jgi:hypothetical protein
MHSFPHTIKAFILLLVFCFNTIVAFACSTSGTFHRFHHQNKSQGDSKKHRPDHHQGHHDDADQRSENHNHTKDTDDGDDNCCSKSAVSFQKVDKSPSRTIEAPSSGFVSALLVTYLSTTAAVFQESCVFRRQVRWRSSATIPDLRIVIQSFQI